MARRWWFTRANAGPSQKLTVDEDGTGTIGDEDGQRPL
jgi:hypothetical protein